MISFFFLKPSNNSYVNVFFGFFSKTLSLNNVLCQIYLGFDHQLNFYLFLVQKINFKFEFFLRKLRFPSNNKLLNVSEKNNSIYSPQIGTIKTKIFFYSL